EEIKSMQDNGELENIVVANWTKADNKTYQNTSSDVSNQENTSNEAKTDVKTEASKSEPTSTEATTKENPKNGVVENKTNSEEIEKSEETEQKETEQPESSQKEIVEQDEIVKPSDIATQTSVEVDEKIPAITEEPTVFEEPEVKDMPNETQVVQNEKTNDSSDNEVLELVYPENLEETTITSNEWKPVQNEDYKPNIFNTQYFENLDWDIYNDDMLDGNGENNNTKQEENIPSEPKEKGKKSKEFSPLLNHSIENLIVALVTNTK
ncbi:MAG: hypothetical protein IJ638_02195, partial [Alphaproteobacteria bacterium]|nr:hypothetical protein [Alphaproteobacteria bacterium]